MVGSMNFSFASDCARVRRRAVGPSSSSGCATSESDSEDDSCREACFRGDSRFSECLDVLSGRPDELDEVEEWCEAECGNCVVRERMERRGDVPAIACEQAVALQVDYS
jgi:hypothetical protein